MPKGKSWLTVYEAADALGIHVNTVRRMFDRGMRLGPGPGRLTGWRTPGGDATPGDRRVDRLSVAAEKKRREALPEEAPTDGQCNSIPDQPAE